MTTREETVLVFGATGAQGGSTARALAKDGWGVRAIVRDPASAPAKELATLGIEVVRGDYRDRASIERAMAGAYGVFSMQPSSGSDVSSVTDEDEQRFGVTIADLAVAAGVRHFVYSSVAGLFGGTGVGHFESKWQIEEHVRSTKLLATIVRPGSFMEMLLLPHFGLAKEKLFFFVRPEQRLQFIAVEDIGKLVARVFASPNKYLGQTVELAGDLLSGDELASTIGKAIDKPITYARFPPEVLAQVPMLQKLVTMIDPLEQVGRADIAALRRELPDLLTVEAWLAKTGAAAIRAHAAT